MKKKAPCFGCTKRFPGCRKTCAEGDAALKMQEQRNETIKKARTHEDLVNRFKYDSIYATKKKAGNLK